MHHRRVIFDTFHLVRHLGDALDTVCRSEYRRPAAKDRAFIKGQRYTLLPIASTSLSTAAGPSPSCSRPTSN
jgi:Transposase